MNRQSRFDAGYRKLGAGALGWPRGMVWGGRWEGGSGLGTCVHPWQIHVDVWQRVRHEWENDLIWSDLMAKPIQYCKVISLQLKKLKLKLKAKIFSWVLERCSHEKLHLLTIFPVLYKKKSHPELWLLVDLMGSLNTNCPVSCSPHYVSWLLVYLSGRKKWLEVRLRMKLDYWLHLPQILKLSLINKHSKEPWVYRLTSVSW